MNSTTETRVHGEDGYNVWADPTAAENDSKLAGQDWYTLWRYWKLAVERKNKHSYAGTVAQTTIDKRRAKSKRAKASRKANR